MEFLHAQSRYNGSSASADSISIRKKVGLLVFDDKPPFKEAHIVFSTRNLTDSIVKVTKTPSTTITSKDNTSTQKNMNPTIIGIPCYLLERPCILSAHGLRRGSPSSLNLDRFDNTLGLLPLTVCTKHGATCFLPLDYVTRMGEYTRTTYNYPIFKVVHSFEDCVLEFPLPPPIGSSEEQSSELDYSRNCYQCFTPISKRRTVYMYRDYLFCCHGCRLKACVARYWYKKLMRSAEDQKQIDFDCDSISAMDKDALLAILS